MPHINLPGGAAGIRSLFMFRPENLEPIAALTQVLLYASHPTLSAGERELIGAYVSSLNECKYCTNSHSAIVKHHLDTDAEFVQQVLSDPETAHISSKLKALFKIAAHTQKGGKYVTPEDIKLAREEGATDIEIHDTVLIAALFCMFNRYVDGLDTWQPDDTELYNQMAEQRVREGYHAGTQQFAVGS